jgi:hypothetical protein
MQLRFQKRPPAGRSPSTLWQKMAL